MDKQADHVWQESAKGERSSANLVVPQISELPSGTRTDAAGVRLHGAS